MALESGGAGWGVRCQRAQRVADRIVAERIIVLCGAGGDDAEEKYHSEGHGAAQVRLLEPELTCSFRLNLALQMVQFGAVLSSSALLSSSTFRAFLSVHSRSGPHS